jgi:hypothetical protein
MHYADKLPKGPTNSGTKAGQQSKDRMRNKYPPEENSAAKVPISSPCIIVDMQGIILAWYLPRILNRSRQVDLSTCLNSTSNLMCFRMK